MLNIYVCFKTVLSYILKLFTQSFIIIKYFADNDWAKTNLRVLVYPGWNKCNYAWGYCNLNYIILITKSQFTKSSELKST
jgi:hypothetical protein